MHLHRQLHPGLGGQRDLPIDPGRLATSVALRRLPHAEQRVAPASQHQLLQVPDRGQILFLFRLEDPLPQPPYVVLVEPPINGIPLGYHVLGSVHHGVSNLPFGTGGSNRFMFKGSPAHVGTPFEARAPARYPASYPGPTTWRSGHIRSGFPVGFRPPAFASWASCSRQRFPLSSRSAYRTATQTGRTLSGFPCSARMRHGRDGCLLYPGAALSSRSAQPL